MVDQSETRSGSLLVFIMLHCVFYKLGLSVITFFFSTSQSGM